MSCGGNMMRTSLQPLAHLVDAAAEKWLAVEHASVSEQQAVNAEITQAFRIGDKPELTFHGLRYLLTVLRDEDDRPGQLHSYKVQVHKIASND